MFSSLPTSEWVTGACGPSILVIIVAQCSGNSGIKSEKKKFLDNNSIFLCFSMGGREECYSFASFFFFLFWQVS